MNFDRPIFVIGAPRSGTSILFRMLSLHPEFWHLPAESHRILEGPWHPQRFDFSSNRVNAEDVTASDAALIQSQFRESVLNLNLVCATPEKMLEGHGLWGRLKNRTEIRISGRKSRRQLPKNDIRLLEKTPKNALRIPALAQVFPDARFIFLHRDAAQTIDSLIAGWLAVDRIGPFRRHRFAASGYPIMTEIRLSRCVSPRWKFALPPRWRQLDGHDIADAAALQYFSCSEIARRDLAELPSERVLTLEHKQLVVDPVAVAKKCLAFAQVSDDAVVSRFAANLPLVNQTSKRNPGHAALRHAADVERVIGENRWKEVALQSAEAVAQ